MIEIDRKLDKKCREREKLEEEWDNKGELLDDPNRGGRVRHMPGYSFSSLRKLQGGNDLEITLALVNVIVSIPYYYGHVWYKYGNVWKEVKGIKEAIKEVSEEIGMFQKRGKEFSKKEGS